MGIGLGLRGGPVHEQNRQLNRPSKQQRAAQIWPMWDRSGLMCHTTPLPSGGGEEEEELCAWPGLGQCTTPPLWYTGWQETGGGRLATEEDNEREGRSWRTLQFLDSIAETQMAYIRSS